jgi:hypothetical protein
LRSTSNSCPDQVSNDGADRGTDTKPFGCNHRGTDTKPFGSTNRSTDTKPFGCSNLGTDIITDQWDVTFKQD